MSTNVFVRDLDTADHARLDSRRAGSGGRWPGFAIDTTLVSPLHQDGVSPQQDAHHQSSGRSGRTPNSQGRSGASGGFGCGDRRPMVRRELRSFCKDWPRLAPSLCRGSFKSVWKKHGSDVRVASWLAAQRVHSRRPCWSSDQPLAREARSPSMNEVLRDARFV